MKFIRSIALFVLSGYGFLSLSSCSGKGDQAGEYRNTDSPVLITLGKPGDTGGTGFSISGQVEASQTAIISTRVMGYITKLNVKAGDAVNKGQLIATISNSDIIAKRAQADAMITEAKANLKSTQKDFDRFTALYKEQSASAKELDNATLQFRAAESRVESAEQMRNEVNAMLAYTSLTAPFAGTVIQKSADAGSLASPGMPIVTIEQKGSYQVSAAVPETEINTISPGEPVMVTIKSVNKIFRGNIAQINQSSQFTGGQYIIKISIPEREKKDLYAGMYATVSILSKIKDLANPAGNEILVPLSSIINKDQLTGLYTVSAGNTALLRWVRLGKIYGDQVVILSGLDKNESFIVRADGKLYNGVPVKVKS